MKTNLRMALAGLFVSVLAAVGLAAPAHATLPPHTGIAAPKGMPGVVPDAKAATSAKLLAGPYYFYAYGNQTVANTGLSASLRIENPYLNPADYHSLGEINVEAPTGAGGTRQIVELGWQKGEAGCANVCLFAGCWINGVFQGYNTGCGYIDEVSNPVNLGASLSGVTGTAKTFQILYASNAWWVAYNGAWVGRFLASSWTSPTFTQASKFQAFGEVAASTTTPCTDMMNGIQGSTFNATPLSGYVASAAYYDTAGVGQAANTNLSFGATNNTKYSVGPVPSSTAPFYTRSGGISGPGWNAAGTATGTAGSC